VVSASLGGVLPRSTTAETLAALRTAVDTGDPLCIGYVDTHGGVSERVIDPVRLAGGYLTAFDHRMDEMHTFAVHRITGVATLEGGAGVGARDNGGSPTDPEGPA
jgi:predicted DNA-binding transcriptional regulator YafY